MRSYIFLAFLFRISMARMFEHTMTIQTDIPGHIARWLFRLGIVWAIILVPVTIVLILPSRRGGGLLLLALYYLIGFAVWLGWRWRGHQRLTRRDATIFWLFSAAYNSSFIIYFIANGAHWTRVMLYDQTAYFAWWWVVATLASLVALVFEFRLGSYEPRTV
jgi:hypothetical protein